MREKTLKYIMTFHTTAAAMAMEKYCKENNIPGRMIPIPRVITVGCGLAWCALPEEKEQCRAVALERNLDMAGEYEMLF
ncbi:MAG: DUF3343 domain-containing protein [Lachnospiraceae bacterium]|nr:DUF3343 domain-containing protein [Lachnospiraceae bacterium]